MSFNIVEEIRKKSREQWIEMPKERYSELRIWIHENPEKAFAAGLGCGMAVMLAFSIIVTIIILAAICFGIILYVAKPRDASELGS